MSVLLPDTIGEIVRLIRLFTRWIQGLSWPEKIERAAHQVERIVKRANGPT